MLKPRELSVFLVALLITACASIPTGPSMMALPGSGKSFDKFRTDDNQCRQFAHKQVKETSADKNSSEYVNQQLYDTSYVQCMYAQGHRVPVYGQFTDGPIKNDGNGTPNNSIPPPPAGKPPPPPE